MSKDDKTEAPTPKRKRDARKKGQIPRSADLVAWLQVLVGTMLLQLTVERTADGMAGVLAQVRAATAHPEEGVALRLFGEGLRAGAAAVVPLAGAMLGLGALGHVAQTGGYASLSFLAPKPERLNPLKGLKRLASAEHLARVGLNVAKVAALTFVVWSPTKALAQRLVGSGRQDLLLAAADAATTTVRVARDAALAGLLIAVVDYGLQRRRVAKSLKMTKQEVRDEHRQSEGDPHVRGQIRQRQLALGRNRMIASVADADVVIVNPTHVAVALVYAPGRGAPRVVAKGRGAVAERIREEARAHGVPLVKDVLLARTMERTVGVGEEIPAALYDAVARVLAFLSRLRGARSFGGVLEIPQVLR